MTRIFWKPVSIRSFLILMLPLLVSAPIIAQQDTTLPAYKNWKLPIESRLNDLLSRMTLQEKIDMVSGAKIGENATNTADVQNSSTPTSIITAADSPSKTQYNLRLGIPELTMTDGPLGPNRLGAATNYGSAINMAATFDDSLIQVVGKELGAETRVLGFNMLLGPCVNIARVPQGGRTFESFGEDPFLVSRMGVAYVKGVQSQRVATCTKHFVCNNQEWNRMSVDVKVSERALREIYLPAFKSIVQQADGWTIMTAYNQTLGYYCAENKYLLTDILENEWGFTGAAVSDWGGVHSTVPTAMNGLDLEMPDGRFLGDDLLEAVKKGQVPESRIDDMARRVLCVIFKAGLFDEPTAAYGGLANTKKRRDLALKVAEKSIVLLKNDHHLLPIKKEQFQKIALIGPNANVAQMCGGGSGSNPGHYGISPLQGIQDMLGCQVAINFERGIAETKLELPVVPEDMFLPPDNKPGKSGVWAEYFNNRDLTGDPVLTRMEKSINFDWGYGAARAGGGEGSPDPAVVNIDRWSARWTGKLKSPGDGLYDIGLQADNGVRMYLNGKLVIDSWTDQAPGKFKIATYKFTSGQVYDLKVEFYENWGSCRCIMGMEKHNPGPAIDQAVQLASNSDLVVVCAGLNKEMEGEALDREELSLPEDQVNLIKKVAKANKNVVVVLYGATPITMAPWIDEVPVVIDALYPGQEGGHALARILFGEVSPSGRLPLTFPKQWADCPAYKSYPGGRDVAHYDEGIYVGYRYFDKNNIEPLFPFGYGLSYIDFDYSGLTLDKKQIYPDDTLTVSFNVKNTGQMGGDEVIQLYISDKKSSVDREVKSLKGFKRISLQPGQSKLVTFTINKDDLSFYDEKAGKWLAEPGMFDIMTGSSSRDIRSVTSFRLK